MWNKLATALIAIAIVLCWLSAKCVKWAAWAATKGLGIADIEKRLRADYERARRETKEKLAGYAESRRKVAVGVKDGTDGEGPG